MRFWRFDLLTLPGGTWVLPGGHWCSCRVAWVKGMTFSSRVQGSFLSGWSLPLLPALRTSQLDPGCAAVKDHVIFNHSYSSGLVIWIAISHIVYRTGVVVQWTVTRYLDGFPDIDEGGAYNTRQPVESHHLLHQHCIHTLWGKNMCVWNGCVEWMCVQWVCKMDRFLLVVRRMLSWWIFYVC